MTKVSIVCAVLAASAASVAADAPSLSGVYKVKLGKHPGTMQIVQDGDFACGTYKGHDDGGWLGGKVDGGKLDGLQTAWDDAASGGFPISLVFSGTGVSGRWSGAWSGALPKAPDVSGDYAVDMGGDKIIIHLRQSGSTVSGKAEYIYSGEPAGTWLGTISGNMVVGTWDDTKSHGRFQWTHSLNRATWLAIDGSYGIDRDHCDNGGTIKGGRKTR